MSHDRRGPPGVLRRGREWVLLDGDRTVLGTVLLVAAFGLLSGLQAVGVFDVDGDVVPLFYLFGALIGGNFTLVTIVISINQLVLSRELRTPGELRSERDAARQYRDAVERETDRPVIPEDPEDFLEVLIRDTRDRVEVLDDQLDTIEEEGARAEVERLQQRLADGLDLDIDTPAEASGVFDALSTVLDADFATWINHVRRVLQTHSQALPESTRRTIEGIEERVEQLDVARQYFKTVYVQQELADLSKVVIYAGLTAVTVAVVFLVYVGHLESPGARPGSVLMPIAVTINLAPMTLLLSHVLRIATVARKTAAISPFISPN